MQEEERLEEGKTSRLEEDKSCILVDMKTTNPEHEEDPELEKILNKEFDYLCDTTTKTNEDYNRDEDLQPAEPIQEKELQTDRPTSSTPSEEPDMMITRVKLRKPQKTPKELMIPIVTFKTFMTIKHVLTIDKSKCVRL
jgi:hypothetical protein